MGNTKIIPIAMKCNKEQFDAVKEKLEHLLFNYATNGEYLTNDYSRSGEIGFSEMKGGEYSERKVYETWNEEIFLNACGIETEPTYTITKEQLLELEKGFTLPKLKQWFPDVFEVKLEVGKWYKSKDSKLLYFILEIKDRNNINAYGFDAEGIYNKSQSNYEWGTPNNYTEATEQEVFEALKNESVKRGFVGNIYVNLYEIGFVNNDLLISSEITWKDGWLNYGTKGTAIFRNGKWATIIKTITKKEAEEKLNCKIV